MSIERITLTETFGWGKDVYEPGTYTIGDDISELASRTAVCRGIGKPGRKRGRKKKDHNVDDETSEDTDL